MAKVVRFYEAGGPDVLRIEDQPVGTPGEGEVRVRHLAVGMNYADTYFRQGYYPVPLPNGMGVEASGVIEAVGPNVNGYSIGDRVTYTGSPLGAYSTERVMPIGSLIKLPVDIDHQTAAAMTMRGLSAAYWLLRTNPWMKRPQSPRRMVATRSSSIAKRMLPPAFAISPMAKASRPSSTRSARIRSKPRSSPSSGAACWLVAVRPRAPSRRSTR